jgi:hypothetical protein
MIKTAYVVHHTHTDIGYTHGQSRIVRWHAAFLRQAMDIAARRDGFAWTCETFYPVEQFWRSADAAERERFAALVKAGRIGLTAGFLHFNELGDAPLLDALAERARRFGDAIGTPVRSAMIADVNGCPLAHARAMARAGVRFLLTCIHPHHGYVPFGKRQELFRWDLGDNLSLMVCHSDHYHTGNELGLAPGGEFNYSAGFTDEPAVFDEDVLERRLPAYIEKLQRAGWPHEFCILTVGGLVTDNSPPSEAVIDRINRWNARHGSSLRLQMSTPGDLAERLAGVSVQTHRGDWPDWWADGPAGDPEAIALFRSAQRDRVWLTAAMTRRALPGVDLARLDEPLGLFVEHTFGHSAAMSHPWNLLAQQLRLKKLGFAGEAADVAEALLDTAGEHLGGGPLSYDRPPAFRVFNPFDHAMHDLAELELDSSEAKRWKIGADLRVLSLPDRRVVPHQAVPSLRGTKLLVDLSLDAGASADFLIEPVAPAPRQLDVRIMVPDRAHDLPGDDADVPPIRLRTESVEIEWTESRGITRWHDVRHDRPLIDPAVAHMPFTLIASRLPAPLEGTAQCTARRALGRNRNAAAARWTQSRLVRAVAGSSGEHVQSVVLDYAMEGCELLQVRLNAWQRHPRVDVEVIMHKLGTWDSENVYLALPFTAGPKAELYLDRGLPVRPGRDQLPGTLCDFYGVQDGLAWCGEDGYGLAVAQADSHLIQTGPLAYGVRPFSTPDTRIAPANVYAWLMTNYWETNFSPELGGFYSFRYSVLWGPDLQRPQPALRACRDANTRLRAIHLSQL